MQRKSGEGALAAERDLLEPAAEALEELAEDISSHWPERGGNALYAVCPGPGPQDALDDAPELIRSVAEALRRRQQAAPDAPWVAPARRHAEKRLQQGTGLSDLVREYQLLGDRLRRALRRRLEGAPAEDGYEMAASLDTALDTMIAVAVRVYDAEWRYALERTARLEAVLEQMPSGVLIAEAPTGRLI